MANREPFRGEARLALRDATADLHARVDAAYDGFDLGEAGGYARVLAAHGRVLPALEASLDRAALWTGWRPRAPLLAADLAELGCTMAPAPRPARTLAGADGWGAQYVLEGSRLGGRMLAGRVGAGLPRRYLAERTGPGGWLRFQDELRAEALAGGAGWLERAIAAARAAFIRFADAAEAHWDAAA